MLTRSIGLALLASGLSFGSADLANAMPSAAAGNLKIAVSRSSEGYSVYGVIMKCNEIIHNGKNVHLKDAYYHYRYQRRYDRRSSRRYYRRRYY